MANAVQSLWQSGSQQTVKKFFNRLEYQATSSASWEICVQVKKQQFELDMELLTGSKLGKEYVKAVCFHPAYLTDAEYIMQNAIPNEAQAGIKIAGRNIDNLRYADYTILIAKS